MPSRTQQDHAKLAGSKGGAWTSCTHLIAYGLLTEPRYLKALVASARMVSASTFLEFGCGIGLASSFIAKSFPNASDVVGIEPNKYHFWDSMGMLSPNGLPRQANVDLVAPSFSLDQLASVKLDKTFDFVHSNEVVEHIPRHLQSIVFDFLSNRTGEMLVFGMAIPGQGGIGHIGSRSRKDVRTQFTNRGLRFLPNMTRALKEIGLAPVAHNRGVYTKNASFVDNPSEELLALKFNRVNGIPWKRAAAAVFDGSDEFKNAHWPKLAKYTQQLKEGKVKCEANNTELDGSSLTRDNNVL